MVSLGFIFGIIFVVLLSVVMLVAVIWLFTEDEKFVSSGIIVSWWLVVLPLTLWGFFPYDMDYHSYKPVSGVVEAMNSRFMSVDKGTEQKFVVKLVGNPQQYGCLDTRCSLLKKGDHINLACIKDWQYAAAPGYNCLWRN